MARRTIAVLAAAALVAAAAGAAGLENVARSASLELAFDAATGTLAVRETASGVTWRSAPDFEPGTPALPPAQQRLVDSPFQLAYVNRAGTTALSADAFTPGVTMSATRIEGGVRAAYELVSANPEGVLRFAVEYRLVGDALEVRVPGDRIAEDGDLMFVSLQVLPFFGAGPGRGGGAFVLPDGSGVLVNWRPPSAGFPVTFSLPLYGEETSTFAAKGVARFAAREEGAPLPAFGMVHGRRVLSGVVTAGAENTRVRGTLAGFLVDLDRIGVEFVYRRSYLAFLSRTKTIQRYPREIFGGDRTVRFSFADRGDWTSVAAAYRAQERLPASNVDGQPSVLVRVFCGARVRRMLGTRLEVATTFAQAADIARAVRAAGVRRFALVLVGWETGGYAGRLPRHRPPDPAFGGERGMRDLAAACRELGVPLYLEADWSVAVPGAVGFRAGRDALRDLNDIAVTDGQGTFLVSPRAMVERFAGPDLAAMASWGVHGVALRGVGRVLMGDYREDAVTGRAGSLGWIRQLEELARAAGLGVLAEGGNAYAAAGAEGLYHVPAAGSGYRFADRDVPLLAAALGGGRWLAGRSLNLAPDIHDAALAEVAAGLVPVVELTAADPVILRGSAYDHLVRSRADEVLADLGGLLAAIDRETSAVAGKAIVGVSAPAEGVTVLAYGGGARLAVNRSPGTFAWEGRAVAAGDVAGAAGGTR